MHHPWRGVAERLVRPLLVAKPAVELLYAAVVPEVDILVLDLQAEHGIDRVRERKAQHITAVQSRIATRNMDPNRIGKAGDFGTPHLVGALHHQTA